MAGTADMEDLLRRESRDEASARLAIEMFVRRAAAGIAASATALPTVDGIVFTGGIGQHAHAVTDRILERLHLVGPMVSSEIHHEDRIDRPMTGAVVMRIAAREDLVIADGVISAVARA
jgi:acetate kinase